jgi:hypothetical protein
MATEQLRTDGIVEKKLEEKIVGVIPRRADGIFAEKIGDILLSPDHERGRANAASEHFQTLAQQMTTGLELVLCTVSSKTISGASLSLARTS